MNSVTFTPAPIFGAFLAAEKLIHPIKRWEAADDLQDWFIGEILEPGRREVNSLDDVLKSIANWDVAAINQFLKDEGFNISLQDAHDPETFYIAAVLKVLVEWLVAGETRTLHAFGREYPAAYLDEGISFWQSPSHHEPIALIATKDPRRFVYMTIAPKPDSLPAMLDLIRRLNVPNLRPAHYGSLLFPKIDLDDDKVDVSWLLGLRTIFQAGPAGRLTQAVQQTKIKINHKGARVESAFAGAVTLECAMMPKPVMLIDRPFMFWMTQNRLSIPLAAAWIHQDQWRDPGDNL